MDMETEKLETVNNRPMKRRISVEMDDITSPMKRCRLINFDVCESLSTIDRMMLNNSIFLDIQFSYLQYQGH
jgi:hypothetical protein